ncbi:MAG: caspase family protein [Bacteroidota bacterium]
MAIRSTSGSKAYFLGIGIDKYQHQPHLFNAVKDVRDFSDRLCLEYQFTPSRSTVLTNEEASRKNILQHLHRLCQELGPGDDLIIYFAGHGIVERDRLQGYWIPVEGKEDEIHTLISHSEIIAFVKVFKARHVVLISDACFSGSIIPRDASSLANRLEPLPSRWVLTSGRIEQVSDGEPGKNSPFSQSMLTCLKYSQERDIPISSFIQQVTNVTVRNARQTPEGTFMFGVGDRGGQFVFHSNNEGKFRIPSLSPYKKPKSAQEIEQVFWEEAQQKMKLALFKRYLYSFPLGIYSERAKEMIQNLQSQERVEEMDWHLARQANELKSIAHFLEKYPQGSYCEDAIIWKKRLEWETVKKELDPRKIETFLTRNPNSRYYGEAQDYWLKAAGYYRGKESEDYIRHVVEKYPTHYRIQEWRDLLVEAEYSTIMRTRDHSSMMQYIQKMPPSKFREKVTENRVKAILKQSGDLALKEIDHFLTLFPDSKYVARLESKREYEIYQKAEKSPTIAGLSHYLSVYPYGSFTSEIRTKINRKLTQLNGWGIPLLLIHFHYSNPYLW